MRNQSLLLRLIGVILVMSLTACATNGQSTTSSGTPTIDRITASQTLRVAMSADQPPFNMVNKQGEVMGLDVDIVRLLAKAMRVELQVVRKPFAELLPALQSGEVDMVASGLAITLERARDVTFSGPYVMSGKSLLAKASSLNKVKNTQAANLPEVRLLALEGSTSETFVRDNLPKAQLTTISEYRDGVDLLKRGEADALIADMPVCVLGVLLYPEAGFVTLDKPFNVEPLSIAVAKGDPQFASLVSNYMTTLDKNGLLALLRSKWLKSAAWLRDMPQAPTLKQARPVDYEKYRDL